MPRLPCLATLALLIVGAEDVQATSVAQDCTGGTFLFSAAAVTGLAVYDIATAPASARRYNEQHLTIGRAWTRGMARTGFRFRYHWAEPGSRQERPSPCRSAPRSHRCSLASR